MCGIAGFLRPGGLPSDSEGIVKAMSDCLAHRGPDDSGIWTDAGAGIALGHRRLSVLDLSAAGHQPMSSASGRYTVAFNGEIYNHSEVRADLVKSLAVREWRGHSDTEILLAAFDRWGIETALKRATGMFAFALWDRQERILTLARDRMGEKPLYYGWQGGTLLFGSELKSLRAHPDFRGRVDRGVLTHYLRVGYVGAPYSIYEGISKLIPGCYIQFPQGQMSYEAVPREYWSLREVAERGLERPFVGSDAEAVERLDHELRTAVASQCVADVPLGAFLSGGVDSSTVVAMMQSQSTRPVKTFTVGFSESRYDEAGYARPIAQRLGTEHVEFVLSPQQAMDAIPRLGTIYDEPFGDSSAIPSLLVAQLARAQVTVALSGDGGDELFGGYERYQRMDKIWSALQRVPRALRKPTAAGVSALARSNLIPAARERGMRLARYLRADGPAGAYQVQMAQCYDAHDLVVETETTSTHVADESHELGDLYSTMMYHDAVGYLPDDILVKVDRATMAVGLEARVPFLAQRVLEFAWQLPVNMKIRGHTGKWALRQVLRRYLPDALTERPKMGFGIPVGQWLRGPLRAWAESLLNEERVRSDGFLNPGMVRRQWQSYLSGNRRGVSDDRMWHLLAFQSWQSSVST